MRELPDSKVDDLPTWVDFRRYDQDQVDAGLITKKESKNRGNYSYNDFARNNIKPMFYKFLEGASFYELARDFGYNPADGTTLTIQGVRYALKNEWAIGNKHRTKHVSKKEWSTELNRFRAQNIVEHENPLHIPTILAKAPLVPVEIWNQVQEKFKGRGKGSKEYGRRKKRSTLFLGHPLLRCAKCDALMYAKNGHGNRADVYYCSAGYRFRKKTCSEHQFSRKKLDDEIALEAVLYLTDDDFLDHKLKECMNEDHLAEARARVEAKQRIVDAIEKKCDRVRRDMEESDDPKLRVRHKQLLQELANAEEEVRTAEDEVSDIPVADVDVMRKQITSDMAGFAEKPVERQKEILKKYITKMVASKNPVTEDYRVKFHFHVTAPAVKEYDWEPVRPQPVTPDGKPVRIKKGGTIGGVLLMPKRTKIGTRYSAWSTR